MTIEFTITDNTVELLSNTDTGENALIINGVEIPSSSWVGSGYYVYDGISIKKISSLSGNVFCNKVSDTEYELAAKSEVSYVTSVNGQTEIVTLDADDIPYNLTQSVGDAIDSNITAINDRALKTNVAKVEPSNTALYRHEVGTYFINKDGNMCRATSLIQVGNTITVNSNCVVVDVGGEISQINNDLSDLSLRKVKSGWFRVSVTANVVKTIGSTADILSGTLPDTSNTVFTFEGASVTSSRFANVFFDGGNYQRLRIYSDKTQDLTLYWYSFYF